MYISVYLFVEIRFLTLLRLIYHFCRLLFAYPFWGYPLRVVRDIPQCPPESGGREPNGRTSEASTLCEFCEFCVKILFCVSQKHQRDNIYKISQRANKKLPRPRVGQGSGIEIY